MEKTSYHILSSYQDHYKNSMHKAKTKKRCIVKKALKNTLPKTPPAVKDSSELNPLLSLIIKKTPITRFSIQKANTTSKADQLKMRANNKIAALATKSETTDGFLKSISFRNFIQLH